MFSEVLNTLLIILVVFITVTELSLSLQNVRCLSLSNERKSASRFYGVPYKTLLQKLATIFYLSFKYIMYSPAQILKSIKPSG